MRTSMNMYEIFNPRNGFALRTTRFRFIAWLLAWRNAGLDYARTGEGWLK